MRRRHVPAADQQFGGKDLASRSFARIVHHCGQLLVLLSSFDRLIGFVVTTRGIAKVLDLFGSADQFSDPHIPLSGFSFGIQPFGVFGGQDRVGKRAAGLSGVEQVAGNSSRRLFLILCPQQQLGPSQMGIAAFIIGQT